MEQTIKAGDFVRLTDPLSNGQIVRIESVDEHGFASWLGGAQNCDMEQIKANVDFPNCSYYDTLSSFVEVIEQGFATDGYDVKLYPKSSVEYWKHRAEVAEQSNALNEKLLDKEHNKLLDAQDELEKLKEHIIKVCKESSADIQKLDEENKELKKELSDNKNHIEVLLGRIEKLELEKHSLDQVAKVFQSDLGKKDTEINELKQRILLLEAELREVD